MHQLATSNNSVHPECQANFAATTDHSNHPFHALTFELQSKVPQTKQRMHELWTQRAGTPHVPEQPVLFSEWPIVASQRLQEQLTRRVQALCQTLKPYLQKERVQAQGWQYGGGADVITVDYAIVCDKMDAEVSDDVNDDVNAEAEGWDIRLVEFQAFTSLLTMGYRLHQVHSQLWPQLADCPPWQKLSTEQAWLDRSRNWLAGGDNPVLLEFQPWQRGTLFDLHAASILWNLPIIEPGQIDIDAAGRLHSKQGGVRQHHDKILNRLILSELSELKDDQQFSSQFLPQLKTAQLHWHSHPAWYFLVQKGLAADIKIPFEPENVKGHQWRNLNLPAQKLVAKNIYSCGGKDLHLGPDAQTLDQLQDAEQWLIQPRFRPYPVMRTQSGSPVYAEVRLILQLEETSEARIAMQIVRMYCAEQASASFFQGREGEGASILHTPPGFQFNAI
ncbi:hypothetical protein [Undibacterium flavidum]|uniref:Uncharacterized protein n=1 Tax=Undibacterium flavidum TaxID=2762297 RepID=A0ABR6Y7X7_9BURK|nr:hypothetical protein [Undibacterium flavidum]MBC3872685.1 hypothetical protein [Undibacterium flavidum]